ncbi:CBS domain-containing protein, partial [Streptococcus pneumoniae]
MITVGPGVTLEEANRLLLEKGIRHLPVMEEGRLVGIITDRDI